MEFALKALADTDSSGVMDVSEAVFDVELKPGLIHQAVVAYMAAGRSGSKAQKTRSQVSGSTVKPWRQKGTGRARAGNTRSPIWRAGGVTFAAQPRDYTQKLNKKMYRVALRSIFSELLRQERLLVVDSFSVSSPKTRELVGKLKPLGKDLNILLITEDANENLMLAARNLYRVAVSDVAGVDPVTLVWAEKVVMTSAALKQLEEKLA